jgi:hypothetical protein
MKLLLVGAACIAACSLPAIIATLGLTGVALGLDASLAVGAALLILLLTTGVALSRKARSGATCRIDGSCGCGETKAEAK